MADKRITELSAVSAFDFNNDLLPIVNNGVTKKTTIANFYDGLVPALSLNFLSLSGGTLSGSLVIGSAGTIYVSGGDSTQWNSVYNSVQSTSASWDSVYSSVANTSANWDSVYTSYSTNSSLFLTNETDSQTLTFDENTSELSILSGNVVSLSAINSSVRELSTNWQNAYTVVNANSAAWDNVSFNDNITYAEGLSAFEQCLRVTIEGKVRYLRLFDIGLELFEFATEDLIDVVGTEDETSVIFFS
jgi:hypothetical protein